MYYIFFLMFMTKRIKEIIRMHVGTIKDKKSFSSRFNIPWMERPIPKKTINLNDMYSKHLFWQFLFPKLWSVNVSLFRLLLFFLPADEKVCLAQSISFDCKSCKAWAWKYAHTNDAEWLCDQLCPLSWYFSEAWIWQFDRH